MTGRQGESWEGPPVGARVRVSQDWVARAGTFREPWMDSTGTVVSHPPPGDDWHGMPVVQWDGEPGRTRKLVPGSSLVEQVEDEQHADPLVRALARAVRLQREASEALAEASRVAEERDR